MGELLPCPFCGGADVALELIGDVGEFYVECKTDGCTGGPYRPSRAEAVAAWNRRRTPSAVLPSDPTQRKPPRELTLGAGQCIDCSVVTLTRRCMRCERLDAEEGARRTPPSTGKAGEG